MRASSTQIVWRFQGEDLIRSQGSLVNLVQINLKYSLCWFAFAWWICTPGTNQLNLKENSLHLGDLWEIHSNHKLVKFRYGVKLTSLTFSKSKTIPVGLRSLKYFVTLHPINSFGCLLSLFDDHDSIKLFPAATICISWFMIIPKFLHIFAHF